MAAPPYLTRISGNGLTQFFEDQYNSLYFPKGDSLWGLPQNAGVLGGATTYQSDIDLYFSTRAAQGYNCAILSCSPSSDITGIPVTGATWDGVLPWTGGVIGSFNTAWWQRVDYAVASAAANGITVFLSPTNYWALSNTGGMLNGITTGQATTYGTGLAARYATAPNVVWLMGNDYNTASGFDPILNNVLAALRAGGAGQLVTIENMTECDSRFEIDNNTVQTWGTANANFQFIYTYAGSYGQILYAYAEANPLLVAYCDGWYDGQAATSQPARDLERNLVWWALTSGSRAYIYGRQNLFAWDTGATHLNDTVFDNTDLKNIWAAFTALTGWHQLIPDSSSTLVTAGRGTKLPAGGPPGVGNWYTGLSGGVGGASVNQYVTASCTPDGTLAVVYVPNAANTITVNPAQLAAGYGAFWIDPATGARTTATIGPTYTRAAANSLGGADWVLAFTSPGYAAWTVP